MELNVRRATLDDAESLKHLWGELANDQLGKDPYYKESFITEEGYMIEKYMQMKECIIYVAVADEKIVGFIEAWVKKKDFEFFIDDYLYITHYYIQPYYRGHMKLFIQLIKKIEMWASKNSIKFIVADVLKNNKRTIELVKLLKYNEYRVKLVKPIQKSNNVRKENGKEVE